MCVCVCMYVCVSAHSPAYVLRVRQRSFYLFSLVILSWLFRLSLEINHL